MIFTGVGVLLSVCILLLALCGHLNANVVSQAAKDARASQDTLIGIFECIELFFRRLDIYTKVPLTTEMMDTIILIMAEILSIFGVATKEIKQSRMSKNLLYKSDNVD